MELTRVDEVTLKQAKKGTATLMASWNGGIFTSSSTLTSGFLSAACALGVCCIATIATSSDRTRGRFARETGMVTVALTSIFNSPAVATMTRLKGAVRRVRNI
jgi:hypothetical protein